MAQAERSPSGVVNESLCCCEYINSHGEKSHVLATCCDCEALDETFDKIFKCEHVPDSTINRLIDTISDRCRFPSCFGQGATKLRLDVLTPIIVVPSCLCLATLHPVMSVLCFLFMPLFIITFHSVWLRRVKRATSFFYSWGLTSVIFSYLVFQCFVVAFREVLLWEILTVFTMMMIMFYFLHLTKKDPDRLRIETKARPSHRRTPSNAPLSSVSPPLYDQISGEKLESGHQFYSGDLVDVIHGNEAKQDSGATWSNQKPTAVNLPPRAGYCRICECYIAVRDHHCIWINSCVGAANHRTFFLAMVMFVLTGIYSTHLTMTTVCTPKMYYDWFLLPSDCRWLYADFLTAICFVIACYVLLATVVMCFGLLFQLILISQNATSHELARARQHGRTCCVFFVLKNPYNRGLLRNWLEFWLLDSRQTSLKS